jgi:hypothetical protein
MITFLSLKRFSDSPAARAAPSARWPGVDDMTRLRKYRAVVWERRPVTHPRFSNWTGFGRPTMRPPARAGSSRTPRSTHAIATVRSDGGTGCRVASSKSLLHVRAGRKKGRGIISSRAPTRQDLRGLIACRAHTSSSHWSHPG